jgi:Zn-dependent peptidase ImmA (M78 family)
VREKIEINAEAIRLRKFFREDSCSPIDVFSRLNNNENLTVVFYPMSERISGMSIRDGTTKLIAINSILTYGRQRFTAAHELCHLFLHETFKSIVCGKDIDQNKDPQEKEADMFASYFLAPYESLKDFISNKLQKERNQLDLNDVIRIEQHYGLSRQATLWRLKNDCYLAFDKSETMKTGIIKSAQKLGFDLNLYLPSPQNKQYYTLGRYIQSAEELRGKKMISNGKYEELLLNAFRADIVYGLDSQGEEFYD